MNLRPYAIYGGLPMQANWYLLWANDSAEIITICKVLGDQFHTFRIQQIIPCVFEELEAIACPGCYQPSFKVYFPSEMWSQVLPKTSTICPRCNPSMTAKGNY